MDYHGNKCQKKFDLEERLIDYAVLIIQIADNMIDTRAGNHIAGQIGRSGTHPALHYGEAQSVESRQDFIHKLKVLLKEQRDKQCFDDYQESLPVKHDAFN